MNRRRSVHLLVILAMAWAFGFTPGVASAVPWNYAESTAGWNYPFPVVPCGGNYCGITVSQGPSASPAQSASTAGGSAAWSYASMDEGVLRSFGSTSGSGTGSGYNAAWAFAQWTDTLTFLSADRLGQSGFAHVMISVDGSLAVAGDGATINANVYVGANGQMMYDVFAVKDAVGIFGHAWDRNRMGTYYDVIFRATNPEFIFDTFAFDIPFTFGTPFTLSTFSYVNVTTPSWTPASSWAVADLGNSTYWGGISSILDENGNPITGYTLTSESGVDWRQSMIPSQSVPEPSALLLLGSGLVGVGIFTWRSRDK